MRLRNTLVLIVLLLAAPGFAETIRGNRNVVTNRDVVALARAGFNEEFIVSTILTSRTRFDTTPKALAALARQGLSEGVIRAMVGCVRPVMPPAEAGAEALYYQERTLFWGLWKKRMGLAPAPAKPAQPGPIPHLGPMYEPLQPPRSHGYRGN